MIYVPTAVNLGTIITVDILGADHFTRIDRRYLHLRYFFKIRHIQYHSKIVTAIIFCVWCLKVVSLVGALDVFAANNI